MKRIAVAQMGIRGSDLNVYQRRDGNAPASRHRLDWLGGVIEEEDGSPQESIKRSLTEKVTLGLSKIAFVGQPVIHEVPAEYASSKELTEVNLFKVLIHERYANFIVKDGSAAEKYTNADIVLRNDLAATVRYVLYEMDPSLESISEGAIQ
jgi:hypothetical protein